MWEVEILWARPELVCKSGSQGGEFVAVTGDDPKPNASTWWRALQFLINLPLRPLYTWFWAWRTVPCYILIMPDKIPQGRQQVLQLMEQQILPIPLDPHSPLPFTAEGGRKAFQIVAGRHAHGKVVVSLES